MISEYISMVALLVAEYGYIAAFLAGFGFFPTTTLALILGATSNGNIILLVLIGGFGSIVGFSLLYLLGYYLRNKDLLQFLKGKGKILRVSEEAYNDANRYLEKRGMLFIFLSRFIPAVKIVTPILAGYLGYSFKYIPITVFLITILQLSIFMFLGLRIGLSWYAIKRIIDISNNIIFTIIGVGVLIYLYLNRKKFFKKKTN